MAYLLGSKITFMSREDTEKFNPSNSFHPPNHDQLKFESEINKTSNFDYGVERLQFWDDVSEIPTFSSEENIAVVAQSVLTQAKMLGKNTKNPDGILALVKKLNIQFIADTDLTLLKKSKLCFLNELFLKYVYDKLGWVMEPVSNITVDGVRHKFNSLSALDITNMDVKGQRSVNVKNTRDWIRRNQVPKLINASKRYYDTSNEGFPESIATSSRENIVYAYDMKAVKNIYDDATRTVRLH